MSAADIVTEVLSGTDFTRNDLRLRSRFKPFVRVRSEICYRLKTETKMSLPAIGRIAGGIHHTTVLHAIESFKQPEPKYKKANDFKIARSAFIQDRLALAPIQYPAAKTKREDRFANISPKAKRVIINRIGAVNNQINSAEKYGQHSKAEQLKVRRELIIEGFL